ncbi:MAG: sialidase family protein [Planctomycetota bacterium]
MQRASVRFWILLGLFPAATFFDGSGAARAQDREIAAVQYERKTIYHSPETPGFTCWTGTWVMPDGSVMVCFTQATGPVEGRPRVPKEIGDKLCWPPPGRPLYDMTGLDLRNVHLRSFDGGQTWKQASADPFRSCMNGSTGQCETALSNGTVLRGVWGHYLPYDPKLPKTGYLQRSHDATETWGPPEVLLDPQKYSAWPKRIRRLGDGRLIVLGGVAPVPANSLTRHEYGRILEPLLMVSEDAGKTWSPPIPVVPPEHRQDWGGEEFDAAELPGGDLICVFRRLNPDGRSGEVRWQGLLEKEGATWVPQHVGPAPFPHSGHPELLATREGVVLHVATSGVDWTGDAGRSWHRLNVPPTRYYPRSVQAPDGRIHVFAHVGSDNAYGSVDQSIVMDTFRLDVP